MIGAGQRRSRWRGGGRSFLAGPFVIALALSKRIKLSPPTVNAALADVERLGIAAEVTGRRRGRVFGYARYLEILAEGTSPPGS